MRKCTVCSETKELKDFPRKGKSHYRRQCRICYNTKKREYYARPEVNAHLKKKYNVSKEALRRRFRNMKFKVYEFVWLYLLEHPCVDCGEKDPLVLEFDHVRGKKYKCISEIVASTNLSKLIAEIKKCDVRCANCHRRKTTFEQKGSYKLIIRQPDYKFQFINYFYDEGYLPMIEHKDKEEKKNFG